MENWNKQKKNKNKNKQTHKQKKQKDENPSEWLTDWLVFGDLPISSSNRLQQHKKPN